MKLATTLTLVFNIVMFQMWAMAEPVDIASAHNQEPLNTKAMASQQQKQNKDDYFPDWTISADEPFVQKIGYLDAAMSEPKDEYVDPGFDTLLIEHLKKQGWQVDIVSLDTTPDKTERVVRINCIAKNKQKIRINFNFFTAGSNEAAKSFISDIMQTSALEPPYIVLPKDIGLGSLAIYSIIEPSEYYWFYRNVYVHTVANHNLGQPTENEESLVLEVQKILNEHTKKIQQ